VNIIESTVTGAVGTTGVTARNTGAITENTGRNTSHKVVSASSNQELSDDDDHVTLSTIILTPPFNSESTDVDTDRDEQPNSDGSTDRDEQPNSDGGTDLDEQSPDLHIGDTPSEAETIFESFPTEVGKSVEQAPGVTNPALPEVQKSLEGISETFLYERIKKQANYITELEKKIKELESEAATSQRYIKQILNKYT